MTSSEPKDGAEVRVPPPVLPVLTILAAIGLQRVAPIAFDLPAPARYWIGGIIVVASILLLGTWCAFSKV